MSAGELVIARWDLDKTYLRTDFDSLRALVRTALERPDQKRAVPGAAALLRELNRSGARLHILSGSPKQLRSRLEEKLALDGVRYSELTLKPNLKNLLKFRFRALREQLGYKLPALLQARVRDQVRAPKISEILSGDDAEADAFVYSLYADLLGGEIGKAELKEILSAGRVFPDQSAAALSAFEQLRPSEESVRILIHLDRQTPPSHFQRYQPRLVPFYNYQQAAYVLLEDGTLDAEGALRVAQNLMLYHHVDADSLTRSYSELARRGHARFTLSEALNDALSHFQAAEPRFADLAELVRNIAAEAAALRLQAPSEPAPKPPPRINYLELAAEHAGGANRTPRLRPR